MTIKKGYNTKHKEELMDFLKTIPGRHVTAGEICSCMKEKGSSIGTATVYRQLEKLVSDGTINKYIGFLKRAEELELLPGTAEAIRKINNSGYLAIVITNQPVIARGEVSVQGLELIHNKLETELGKEGAYIDGLYYCPHHPDKGFEGEVVELKFDCDCRKPKPGLILRAEKDFNIDLNASWMIGDGRNDVDAGKNAGTHTALIGYDENLEADIKAESLLEIVEEILRK